jgi:hypothetical protein
VLSHLVVRFSAHLGRCMQHNCGTVAYWPGHGPNYSSLLLIGSLYLVVCLCVCLFVWLVGCLLVCLFLYLLDYFVLFGMS